VTVAGTKVTVTVNSGKLSFETPEAKTGFFGFRFTGKGYVELSNPQVR